ncbi:MAG: acyloxyacyl hydrolase [Edaphobacter sp.]
MKSAVVWSLAAFLILASPVNAQIEGAPSFGSKNTFAAFVDYSNDSSHIVLGNAEGRKFTELGFQYERRLKSNRHLVWKYTAEFRPLIAESDLTVVETIVETSPPPAQTIVLAPVASPQCRPFSESFSVTDPTTGVLDAGTVTINCGRRWTYVEGLSPLGTRINLLPHRRWQPTGSILTGILLSSKKIPVDTGGSFNFTFQLGAGVEYFRTPSQSLRLEYQIQHFSNAYTAPTNYGVDNGLLKLTYTFGR